LRSGIGRGLEARERRTIALGVAVIALAAFVTQVAVPYARRFGAREALIGATRARVARLTMLAGHEAEIQQKTRARDAELEAAGVRLLHARTPALAASALQALIREHARASGVAVSRMDVAGTVDAVSTSAVPATISAVGDIYGVAQFLSRLQHGRRLLDVREVSMASSSGLRGGLLQLSVTVHAPFVSEE
jgi:type II secretory pathway component PulM